ncbi:MAG: C10 family peptidase [Bacteroidaceae bacterium]|nr:C10 family peptidase [Bacteroidaceae bacterium]
MKKHLLLAAALFVAVAMPALADQLTPEQSVARLMAGQSGPHRVKGVQADRLQLTYTSASVQGNRYYVFNQKDNGGFVILGADDLAPNLLAYTTQGLFDEQHMAPGLRYWLSEYDRYIGEAIATGRPVQTASRNKVRAAIQPILTTTWGQGDAYYKAEQHYNIYCPQINGTYSPTGCVATAMAQIMNHHQHPKRGTGSKSYTSNTHKLTLSANFGQTTYKWAEMQDHYGYTVGNDGRATNEPFSTSANEAVSTLMYHCGIAAEMDYAPQASGAMEYVAAKGMLQYFGYDQGAYLADKIFYTADEWEDLLHAELSANRPVLYTGATTNREGHAFVCDGYDGQRFHINWGWNGMSDGYYTVLGFDALHPKEQGTGGSYTSGAFSEGNTAFIGMKPAQAGSKPHHQVVCGGSYTVRDYYNGGSKLTNGSPITLNCPDFFYGYNLVDAKMKFGVRLVNTSTQATYYASEYQGADVSIYLGNTEVYLYSSNVPEGVYKAYPVFQVDGETEWQDMLVPQGIEAPSVTYGNVVTPTADAQLICSSITCTDAGNKERTLNAKVNNPGNMSGYDFKGKVTLGLVNDAGESVTIFKEQAQDFEFENQSYTSNYSFSFSIVLPQEVENGHYRVMFYGYQPGSVNWTPAKGLIFEDNKAYLSDTNPYLDIWVANEQVSPTEISPTGLSTLTPASASRTQYDLQGRRTTHQPAGLHITEGHKVILK